MLFGTFMVAWTIIGLLVDVVLRRHTRYSRVDHLILRILCWPVPILQTAIDAAYDRWRDWP
jgi:hypothetical protein